MVEVSDINLLSEFTKDFCDIVEKHCKYMIVSGYLAIATGRSRGTEDIDIIIEKLNKDDYIKLHDELIKKFESLETDDVDEIYERLIENSNMRYVYKNTLLPNMGVKFVKDEVDKAGILNRIKIPFTKLDVWFSPISSGIAFKETILNSKKDVEDSIHLRETFKEEIDEEEIKYFKDLIERCR